MYLAARAAGSVIHEDADRDMMVVGLIDWLIEESPNFFDCLSILGPCLKKQTQRIPSVRRPGAPSFASAAPRQLTAEPGLNSRDSSFLNHSTSFNLQSNHNNQQPPVTPSLVTDEAVDERPRARGGRRTTAHGQRADEAVAGCRQQLCYKLQQYSTTARFGRRSGQPQLGARRRQRVQPAVSIGDAASTNQSRCSSVSTI